MGICRPPGYMPSHAARVSLWRGGVQRGSLAANFDMSNPASAKSGDQSGAGGGEEGCGSTNCGGRATKTCRRPSVSSAVYVSPETSIGGSFDATLYLSKGMM